MGSIDSDTIVSWIGIYPDCNFGLLMGSGYVCLDVDNKAGKNGFESLRTELHDGPINTLSVTTPNRGRHYLFSTNGRDIHTQLGLFEGIDVIGSGG